VVLANGAEGEPLSRKDRMLMELRPHLVLDGALLAAAAIGAREIVLYVGAEHTGAIRAVQRAVQERAAVERVRLSVVSAPYGYVSGEATAAVHFVNSGIALPTSIPPRPHERGIDGRPTLVQNVETLAHVALIARRGAAWFRSLGVGEASGTTLVTVGGAVPQTILIEVPQGSTIAEAVNAAGGLTADADAVLLGGYFGGWVESTKAWGLPLDAETLRAHGFSLGCGVIAVLPEGRCGVVETAKILAYLAHESARQCGPCTFGLRAVAATLGRVAGLTSTDGDLEHIQRWSGLLAGRGACRHPDGAAGMLDSALHVFADEFTRHHRDRRCHAGATTAVAA
jgi:NADH:ubiquinone oxidoreductase subunit F (NADH-binding)